MKSTNLKFKSLILVILVGLLLTSCFKREGCVIYKRSVIDPLKWDEVIHVYGFVDDQDVTEELTDYLNRAGRGAEEYDWGFAE